MNPNHVGGKKKKGGGMTRGSLIICAPGMVKGEEEEGGPVYDGDRKKGKMEGLSQAAIEKRGKKRGGRKAGVFLHSSSTRKKKEGEEVHFSFFPLIRRRG